MAKGVSAAEKRERLLKLFHTTREVMNKKEIEKRGAATGIPGQAVLDVLKQLTDDDLVKETKVGVSTYWWSWPGEMGTKKRNDVNKLSMETHKQQQQIAALTEQVQQQQEAAGGASEAAEVERLEGSIVALKEKGAAVKAELERLKAASSNDVHARKRDIAVLRDAANRWTDNIFTCRKKMSEIAGVDEKDIDKGFHVPSDLDYIE